MKETQENNNKYTIKGIEKIIEVVSKKELADYFEKSEESDFTQDILQMLKYRNVPSGMEIESFNIGRGVDDFREFVAEIRTKESPKDGRGLIGLKTLPFGFSNMLFLYVDTPITEEQLIKMGPYLTYGGVMTLNSFMGTGFYEKHKQEIDKLQETISKNWAIRSLVDSKNLTSDETLDDDYNKEVKNDIHNITGKEFESLTLLELKNLKAKLKAEVEKIQKSFSDKYAIKSETEKY